MSTETTGELVQVTEDTLGSAIAIAAAAGDTTIYVYDTIDFAEQGGDLQLNGSQYGYSSAEPGTQDNDGPFAVELDSELQAGAAVDDAVQLLVATGDLGVDLVATVLLGASDEEVDVDIPPQFIRHYKLGDEQAGAVVPLVELANGTLQVAGAPGTVAAAETNLSVPQGFTQLVDGIAELTNGIDAPVNPARAGNSWGHPAAFVARLNSLGNPYNGGGAVERGLFSDSGRWLYAASLFGTSSVSQIDKTTGQNLDVFFTAISSGFNAAGGVVMLGTNYYLLGFDTSRSNNWYVYKYNSAGVKQLEWRFIAGGTAPKWPALCLNGSNLMIAYWTTAGGPVERIVATTFSPDGDGAGGAVQVGSSILCDIPGKADLVGLYYGSADFGSSHLVALTTTGMRVFSVTGTTGTRAATKEWSRPDPTDESHGLAWDGTRFCVLGGSSGKVWRLSQNAIAHSREIEWTRYSSTGGYETPPAERTLYTQQPRQWLLVEIDPTAVTSDPTLPDSGRVYIDNQRQADLGAGVSSVVYDIPSTGGISPPTSNGFEPVSAPGALISSAADAMGRIIQLLGSGNGLVGPLGFSPDRGPVEVLTGGSVITIAANWSLTSANVQRFGCWVQGLIVFTRTTSTLNVVDGTADLANTAVGTLNDGLRPAINLGGQSGSAGRNAAYDIAPTGVISLAAVAGPDDIAVDDTLSVGFGYFAVSAA